jgi:hypothetical protein
MGQQDSNQKPPPPPRPDTSQGNPANLREDGYGSASGKK